MGRPHIECIHESAVAWAMQELSSLPAAEVKTLSSDPENENHTSLLRLPSGWTQRGTTAHPAPEEIFVISGRLRVGDLELGPYHYLRVAPLVRHGPTSALEDTLAIWIVEGRYGPVTGREPSEATDLVHVDAGQMQWRPTWVPGPRPGLHIKLLYMGSTGAYTRLIRAEPGWREDRLEHHDCAEEAYTLEGEMYLGNTGRSWGAGSYFWRPPGIKHGPMHTGPGALFFLRTDGPLVNHYTTVETPRDT